MDALRTVLEQELSAVEAVAADARSEATGAESKQEGKYDTRATEASYLARGQAWRVVELRKLVAWFANLDGDHGPPVIGLGSLVELGGDREEWVFLAPVGGTRTSIEGAVVGLVSPLSPLGAALIGLEVDDLASVATPQGTLEVEVIQVL